MAAGAKNITLYQIRFFHARTTFSQSLRVADSTLKFEYASVKFVVVDPLVQIYKT